MNASATLSHAQFWKAVFYFKGAWNCCFTTVFFFFENHLRDSLGVAHPDPAYQAMFLVLAFVFGLGYWRVGQNISDNRDIVRGGVLGQLAVFVIVANEVFLAKRLPILFIVPAVVDLSFAVLFVVFLMRTRKDNG